MLSLPSLLLAYVAQIYTPDCPSPETWLAGEQRQGPQGRLETRRRMRATWRAMGFAREAVEVLDAIVVRESSGDRCAVHRLGPNEDGLGPGGLQVRFHLAKWDPSAPPQVLHVPEVSAVVMGRMFRRYKERYKARTWLRVGQIYGGRIVHGDIGMDELWCQRLARRGVDCSAELPEFGRKLGLGPTPGQLAFVVRLQAKWEARAAR